MLAFLGFAAGWTFIIVVFVTAMRTGGIRMRNGSIIGRQETQQEFDEKIARLEAQDAKRKRRFEGR